MSHRNSMFMSRETVEECEACGGTDVELDLNLGHVCTDCGAILRRQAIHDGPTVQDAVDTTPPQPIRASRSRATTRILTRVEQLHPATINTVKALLSNPDGAACMASLSASTRSWTLTWAAIYLGYRIDGVSASMYDLAVEGGVGLQDLHRTVARLEAALKVSFAISTHTDAFNEALLSVLSTAVGPKQRRLANSWCTSVFKSICANANTNAFQNLKPKYQAACVLQAYCKLMGRISDKHVACSCPKAGVALAIMHAPPSPCKS